MIATYIRSNQKRKGSTTGVASGSDDRAERETGLRQVDLSDGIMNGGTINGKPKGEQLSTAPALYSVDQWAVCDLESRQGVSQVNEGRLAAENHGPNVRILGNLSAMGR